MVANYELDTEDEKILDEEMHYENVYSTKEKALEDGKKVLEIYLK